MEAGPHTHTSWKYLEVKIQLLYLREQSPHARYICGSKTLSSSPPTNTMHPQGTLSNTMRTLEPLTPPDSNYSRLSIIRAWFNRFAAQPRQSIFKEKILFSMSITFV
jgi:hypothetical protein